MPNEKDKDDVVVLLVGGSERAGKTRVMLEALGKHVTVVELNPGERLEARAEPAAPHPSLKTALEEFMRMSPSGRLLDLPKDALIPRPHRFVNKEERPLPLLDANYSDIELRVMAELRTSPLLPFRSARTSIHGELLRDFVFPIEPKTVHGDVAVLASLAVEVRRIRRRRR